MKIKILILIFLIGFTVFSHFINQHKILKYSRKIQKIEKKLNSEKIINGEMKLSFNRLSSRDRIEKLAVEELGMITPKPGQNNLFYIREVTDKSEKEYCIIDFFAPSLKVIE